MGCLGTKLWGALAQNYGVSWYKIPPRKSLIIWVGATAEGKTIILTPKNARGTQKILNCASKQEVSFLMLKSFVIAGLIPQSLEIEAQITLVSLGVPEGFILYVLQVVCCCVSAQRRIVRK